MDADRRSASRLAQRKLIEIQTQKLRLLEIDLMNLVLNNESWRKMTEISVSSSKKLRYSSKDFQKFLHF